MLGKLDSSQSNLMLRVVFQQKPFQTALPWGTKGAFQIEHKLTTVMLEKASGHKTT